MSVYASSRSSPLQDRCGADLKRIPFVLKWHSRMTAGLHPRPRPHWLPLITHLQLSCNPAAIPGGTRPKLITPTLPNPLNYSIFHRSNPAPWRKIKSQLVKPPWRRSENLRTQNLLCLNGTWPRRGGEDGEPDVEALRFRERARA